MRKFILILTALFFALAACKTAEPIKPDPVDPDPVNPDPVDPDPTVDCRADIVIDGDFSDWDKAENLPVCTIPEEGALFTELKTIKVAASASTVYLYIEFHDPSLHNSYPCDIILDSDGNKNTGYYVASDDKAINGKVFNFCGGEWYIEADIHKNVGYNNLTREGVFEYTGPNGDSVFSNNKDRSYSYGPREIFARGENKSNTGRYEIQLDRKWFRITGEKVRVGVKLMDGKNGWATIGVLPQLPSQDGKYSPATLFEVEIPAFVEPKPVDDGSGVFNLRGVAIRWNDTRDRDVLDYLKISKEHHLNTLSIYGNSGYYGWNDFENDCFTAGVDIENESHGLSAMLPRNLFAEHPEYFRMKRNGQRTNDANGCPSCQEALDIVYQNAIKYAKEDHPSNHKYYYWLDDGGDICYCPKCQAKGWNAADQALIYENTMLRAIKTVDPRAELCHLCYFNTKDAPRYVKPEDGIFLEFAPIERNKYEPLSHTWVKGGDGLTHGQYLKSLGDNLKVFPEETAQVLEYWMDCSLFSDWNESKLKAVPWNKELFLDDLKTYDMYGVHNIMCYAFYVSKYYMDKFGYPSFLEEYADELYNYGK